MKKIKKEANNKTIQAKTGSPTKKKKEEESQEVWKWYVDCFGSILYWHALVDNRLTEFMFRWEEDKYDSGVKWKTLEHKGPVFAPDYDPLPKDVKFFYNGKFSKYYFFITKRKIGI